jgi:hypothetical protein
MGALNGVSSEAMRLHFMPDFLKRFILALSTGQWREAWDKSRQRPDLTAQLSVVTGRRLARSNFQDEMKVK